MKKIYKVNIFSHCEEPRNKKKKKKKKNVVSVF